jgi:hypothetical protein
MRRLGLILVFVAGCGKSDVPSCAAVTDHTLELTVQKYPAHGDMLKSERPGLVDGCEKKFDAATRRCIMAAKDLDAISACRGGHQPVAKPPSATSR